MQPNTTIRILPALLGLALLAGCGGGGGGGGSSPEGPGAPAGLAYGTPAAIWLLAVEVDPIVPAVQGAVDGWTVEPSLPAGLALDPASGEISGRPAELAPLSSYVVTAAGPGGTASTELRLGVAPPPIFAYVANTEDDTLSMFTVEASDGSLRHNGYLPVPPGSGPRAIQVRPDNRYAYVTNDGDLHSPSTISVYEISMASGRLLERAPAPTGIGPHHLALHPGGSFAYVSAYGSDAIHTYAIDAATGALTQVGAPIGTEAGPGAIGVDPAGKFAYVVNRDARSLSIFSIDPLSGAFDNLISSQTVAGVPSNVALDPQGDRVYVVLEDSDLVEPYDVDRESGGLTKIGAEPTGNLPSSVAVHPTGRFAYVTNASADSLSIFHVDEADGTLLPAGEAASGEQPGALSFDASGLYAFALNRGGNSISMYRVSLEDGGLHELGRVRTREHPSTLAIATGDGPLRKDARFLYVASAESGDLTSYAVDEASGALTELGPPIVAGIQPRDVVVDPDGRWAVVADTQGALLTRFRIDAQDGSLTMVGPPLLLPGFPRGIEIDPSGRHVYVATRDEDLVLVFELDHATGALTQVDSAPAGENPHSVSIDPTGRFLYVSNAVSGDISVFEVRDGELSDSPLLSVAPGSPREIRFSPLGDRAYTPLNTANHLVPYDVDPHTGLLTPIPPGKGTGNRPSSIVVHPSGRYAYAAVHGEPVEDGHVGYYVIDQAEGHLTEPQTAIAGLHPRDLAIDPSGRFLFVANEGSDDLSVFAIDPESGAPALAGTTATGLAPRAITFTTVLRTSVAP